MDSYSRGYNAGLEDGAGKNDGLSDAGFHIGTATTRDDDLPIGAEDASFYAGAYNTQYGIAISYLGTGEDIISGALNGYGLVPQRQR